MRNSKLLAGVTVATPVLLAGEANSARLPIVAPAVGEATIERAQAQVRLKRALLKLDLDAKVRIAGDRLLPLRSAQFCQTPPRSVRGASETALCPSVGACMEGQAPAADPGGNGNPQTQNACVGDDAVIYTALCSEVQQPEAIRTPTEWGCTPSEAAANTAVTCVPSDEANTYTSILCPRGPEAQPQPEAPPVVQPPPSPERTLRTRPPRTIPATVGCQ